MKTRTNVRAGLEPQPLPPRLVIVNPVINVARTYTP